MNQRQSEFVQSIAKRIPELLKSIEDGGWCAVYRLGSKRLPNGKTVVLQLVATEADSVGMPDKSHDKPPAEIE